MATSMDCWIVRARGDATGGVADVMRQFLAFNTYKFMSRPAALAWCREKHINPIDFVLLKVRFREPKVLEVTEIDYSSTALALAGGE